MTGETLTAAELLVRMVLALSAIWVLWRAGVWETFTAAQVRIGEGEFPHDLPHPIRASDWPEVRQ